MGAYAGEQLVFTAGEQRILTLVDYMCEVE